MLRLDPKIQPQFHSEEDPTPQICDGKHQLPQEHL